jgi:hypothetical protein
MKSEVVSLAAAAAWIEQHGTGQRPHTSTLTRWIHRGVRGHKLPAIRAGAGRYVVALSDVAAFIQRLNTGNAEPPAIHAIAHELEMRQLDAILGKPARAAQVQRALDDLDRVIAPKRPGRQKAK